MNARYNRRDASIVITVVGSGYVGLVAATCFAELGHAVICVDNNQQRTTALQQGNVPIYEDILPELLRKHAGKSLTFSSDLATAVRASTAIFIAVGTPTTECGEADLSAVAAVIEEIADSIDDYKIIVEKSTVPVQTSDWITSILLGRGVPRSRFDVVSNPEFLREGTAITDFMHPDRILVGTTSNRAWEIMHAIYAPLTEGQYYASDACVPGRCSVEQTPLLIRTSPASSELIKHAANAFLAMKISFINSVANLCEAVGADIEEVALGIGTDRRIGKGFLNAGIGYGGSCFPKDVTAFCSVASQFGVDLDLLVQVREINLQQRERFVAKVRTTLGILRGKRLGVLGLAFKGGTDDVRESPALSIIASLLKEGCTVVAHDPAAMANTQRLLSHPALTVTNDPYSVADEADAILVLTDWQEFAQLDYVEIKKRLGSPIVFDGRNLLNLDTMAAIGFTYLGVGRRAVSCPTPQRSHFDIVTAIAS